MLTVTKTFTFEAAHYLPDYDGKCAHLHGHSYRLDVTVLGRRITSDSPKKGMVIDFSDLKKIVKEVAIDKYDHGYLNDHFENPTAENMVVQIAEDIQKKLPKGVFVKSCRLWETATAYAEYSPEYQALMGNLLQPAT